MLPRTITRKFLSLTSQVYDASGYGWDDDDKIKELTEEGTRFLLVREKQLNYDDVPGRLVAFAHFRFTIQGHQVTFISMTP